MYSVKYYYGITLMHLLTIVNSRHDEKLSRLVSFCGNTITIIRQIGQRQAVSGSMSIHTVR